MMEDVGWILNFAPIFFPPHELIRNVSRTAVLLETVLGELQ